MFENVRDNLIDADRDDPTVDGDYAETTQTIRHLYKDILQDTQTRYLFPVMPVNHEDVRLVLEDPIGYFGLHDVEIDDGLNWLKDFQEGAAAYTIGLYNAAIFFLFRGAEGFARYFYEQVFGVNEQSWAKILSSIKILPDLGCDSNETRDCLVFLQKLKDGRNKNFHAGREQEAIEQSYATHVLFQCKTVTSILAGYLTEESS